MKLRLSDQPVAYDKLVNAVLLVLMGFGVVDWTKEQFALVLGLWSGLAGIIVWNAVTTNSNAADQATAAVDAKETEIHAYLQGAEDAAPPPAKVTAAKVRKATKS